MSKRREVQQHIAALNEVEGIMGAMKNLALLETHRLARFLETQRRAVKSIEAAAGDFLHFYPQPMAQDDRTGKMLLVVIGSERGLCGDFNEQLLEPLDIVTTRSDAVLVIVGGRLGAKLRDDTRNKTFVDGPTIGEEVQPALGRLVKVLSDLQRTDPEQVWRIHALYHDDESGEPRLRQFLPLEGDAGKSLHSYAPLLNLEPRRFFSQLTDQYLFAVLYEVFYSSLMVENRKRLEHMDSAIRRMEKDQASMRLRYNALRQEEIIEEIEVIMLSAEALLDSI